MDFVTTSNLLGLIILILDVLALIQVLSAPRSIGYKLGWSLAILFLPVLGLILYAIFGGWGSRTVVVHRH